MVIKKFFTGMVDWLMFNMKWEVFHLQVHSWWDQAYNQ